MMAAAMFVAPTSIQCADFASAMARNDIAGAKALTIGDAEVNPDIAKDIGRKTLPFEALAFWVKTCRISPSMSKQYEGFYHLWWNCGTEVRKDGVTWRRMVRVFLVPSGKGVQLKNLMKGNFPDFTSESELRAEDVNG